MIIEPSLQDAIGRREATIRHDLADAPEFDSTRLVAVAKGLPPPWLLSYDASGARVQLDHDDLLPRMASGVFSLRMCHLELVPSFKPLIQRCYDGAAEREAAAKEGGVTGESSIVFLGSPGATTPPHLDHHHNLLFQLRGRKRLTISRFDRPGRQEREVERAFEAMGACRATPTSIDTYVLAPGDGLYLPAYTFHSAEVLEGSVSVALSCAFSTSATERAYRMHRAHRALSRVHLRLPPTGVSPTGSAITEWLGRWLQRIRHSAV